MFSMVMQRGASLLNVLEQVQPSTSSRLHSFRRYRQPRPRASTRMGQLRSYHRAMSSTANQRNSMFPPNMDVELVCNHALVIPPLIYAFSYLYFIMFLELQF